MLGNARHDQEAHDLLSTDRLEGFRVRSGRNDDRALLGRYMHNVAISHALYPYLHAAEVILRNRIFSAVARAHAIDRDRPDLYDDFACWLDMTSPILTDSHRKEVKKAKDEVRKDLRRRVGAAASRNRRLLTPGRLVAKLPFSFWVFLFDYEYVGNGRGDLGILWPRFSQAVFPGRTSTGIVDVRKTLRRLHVVRNRVMHYERISPWDESKDTALRPDHVRGDILQLLEWMSPRVADIVRNHAPHDYLTEPAFGRYLRLAACQL